MSNDLLNTIKGHLDILRDTAEELEQVDDSELRDAEEEKEAEEAETVEEMLESFHDRLDSVENNLDQIIESDSMLLGEEITELAEEVVEISEEHKGLILYMGKMAQANLKMGKNDEAEQKISRAMSDLELLDGMLEISKDLISDELQHQEIGPNTNKGVVSSLENLKSPIRSERRELKKVRGKLNSIVG